MKNSRSFENKFIKDVVAKSGMDELVVRRIFSAIVRVIVQTCKQEGRCFLPDLGFFAIKKVMQHDVNNRTVGETRKLKFQCDKNLDYYIKHTEVTNFYDKKMR